MNFDIYQKIFKKRLVLSFVMGFILILFNSILPQISLANEIEPSKSDPRKENWYIGPRIGISPYTGIIGLEIQNRHFALSLGLPTTIGLKYYFKPYRHSWFIGPRFLRLNIEEDTTSTEFGLGGGYRWRWGSGWDLSFSVAFSYGKKEETVGFFERTSFYYSIMPGFTVGYSF